MLTHVTIFHIFVHIDDYFELKILSFDKVFRFFDVEVFRQRIIVIQTKKFCFQNCFVEHIYSSKEVKQEILNYSISLYARFAMFFRR